MCTTADGQKDGRNAAPPDSDSGRRDDDSSGGVHAAVAVTPNPFASRAPSELLSARSHQPTVLRGTSSEAVPPLNSLHTSLRGGGSGCSPPLLNSSPPPRMAGDHGGSRLIVPPPPQSEWVWAPASPSYSYLRPHSAPGGYLPLTTEADAPVLATMHAINSSITPPTHTWHWRTSQPPEEHVVREPDVTGYEQRSTGWRQASLSTSPPVHALGAMATPRQRGGVVVHPTSSLL